MGAFVNIARHLTGLGHAVMVTTVHPTASIALRAAALKHAINEQLAALNQRGRKVIILAHSMGGLDARHMIARLGMEQSVTALVTISTPHRGSPYADYLLRHLNRFKALQLFHALGLDASAAIDLTTGACAEFNERTPDVPGVKYFSVSAARPMRQLSPLLYASWKIIDAVEGDNDGMVSVKSAAWANHLGTWPADHFHLLNHRFVLEVKQRTGDIRPYYAKLLKELSAAGIGRCE
jgi:triacylglycerol lipase